MKNQPIGFIWLFFIAAMILTYKKLMGNQQITWTSIIILISITIGTTILGFGLAYILEYMDNKNDPLEKDKQKSQERLEESEKKWEEHEKKWNEYREKLDEKK